MTKNEIKQNEFVERVKALSIWDKIFYLGSIATILGFLLPFLSITGGMFLKMPYVWLLFIIALALPIIKIFTNKSQLKHDLLFGLSESLAVISLFGMILIDKISKLMGGFSYNSIGVFDMIGVGAIFLIIGSIVTFLSIIMNKE